jgi:hypothetical protein
MEEETVISFFDVNPLLKMSQYNHHQVLVESRSTPAAITTGSVSAVLKERQIEVARLHDKRSWRLETLKSFNDCIWRGRHEG